MAWTTADFIADVKLKGLFPDTWNITDSELLRVGDGEVRTKVAPLVLSTEQEFWVDFEDTSLTTSTTYVLITSRAYLGKVRMVTLINPEGNESDPIVKVPLERFNGYNVRGWGQSVHYTVRGDKILLSSMESIPPGWTLRVYYYARPSKMVELSAAMAITGVAGAVLSGTVPSGITTSTPVDVLQALPNFSVLARSKTPSSIAGGVTLTSSVADVVVGDYVALAGQTPVVPVPDACYELLVSATTYQLLKINGFFEQASFERGEMKDAMASVLQSFKRVKSPGEKVINRHGPLRQGR